MAVATHTMEDDCSLAFDEELAKEKLQITSFATLNQRSYMLRPISGIECPEIWLLYEGPKDVAPSQMTMADHCQELENRLHKVRPSSSGRKGQKCRDYTNDNAKITYGADCLANPLKGVALTFTKGSEDCHFNVLTELVGHSKKISHTMNDCHFLFGKGDHTMKPMNDSCPILIVKASSLIMQPKVPLFTSLSAAMQATIKAISLHCIELSNRLKVKKAGCSDHSKDKENTKVTLGPKCLKDPSKGIVLKFHHIAETDYDYTVETVLVGSGSGKTTHTAKNCTFFSQETIVPDSLHVQPIIPKTCPVSFRLNAGG